MSVPQQANMASFCHSVVFATAEGLELHKVRVGEFIQYKWAQHLPHGAREVNEPKMVLATESR